MDLRVLYRHVELLDQVERVVRAQAGGVHVLREQQRDQHGDGDRRLRAGQGSAGRRRLWAAAALRHRRVAPVPEADVGQQQDRQQRRQREPCDAGLSVRHHDECRQQRPDGRPGTAAHLKQRLRESVAPAGSHACHPRRLRMEDGRPDTHQRRREQDDREGTGDRQQQQAGQRVNSFPPAAKTAAAAGRSPGPPGAAASRR